MIDLGRNFTSNFDDANNVARLSYSMIMRSRFYPNDKRVAYAIHSGLLEMCFEFMKRFECDPRDELMYGLICIAQHIQTVAFHLETAKALRERWSQVMLRSATKPNKSRQFVQILSSVIDLNKGSCSRCNKPIAWHTMQFCGGCRRVVYCGVKCQKEDWKNGTHSSDCLYLACSADVVGLTKFEVSKSRNISKLKALKNNIIATQKKLFSKHEDSILNHLLVHPNRLDYVVVFKYQQVVIADYRRHFTCSKQITWFEGLRSLDKVVCVYTSHVLNGEWDEEGIANTISLYATFPIPQRNQSSISLYASAKRNNFKTANPDADSGKLNQIIAKHDPDTIVDLHNDKHVIDSTITSQINPDCATW